MNRNLLVSAMPPTTNGDLHVGHMSGAFFAADVFTRFRRLKGDTVVYYSTSDDNQSYIVTTAARLGMQPRQLCRESTEQILSTLRASSIEIDAFPTPRTDYEAWVRQFVDELVEIGAVVEKEIEVLYCGQTGLDAFEAYVKGHCPVCYSNTVGAVCETCGHPNDHATLLDPYWALDPTLPLTRRRQKALVFPLEQYRQRLKDFFAERWPIDRRHMLIFLDELFERPLADYPVTYRSDYGIPVRRPGYNGQVVNVWVEMLPGLMYSSTVAARRRGLEVEDFDSFWRRGSGFDIAQFHGFDNTYFVAALHVALLMAFGDRYSLPQYFIANAFYELDHEKFSTSRRHVIWARDLLDSVSADEMRLYLSLSNPEHQRTNFALSDMKSVVKRRWETPWSELVGTLNRISIAIPPVELRNEALTLSGMERLQRLAQTFARYYDAPQFSVQNVANRLVFLLDWMRGEAAGVMAAIGRQRVTLVDARRAKLLWAYVDAFTVFAFPLLPDFSKRVRTALDLPPEPPAWGVWSDGMLPPATALPTDLWRAKAPIAENVAALGAAAR